MSRIWTLFTVCAMVVLTCLAPAPARAGQSPAPSAGAAAGAGAGTVGGTVADPLGARVAGAAVRLIGERQQPVAETRSGEDGSFAFTGIAPGRYQVVVDAGGFDATTTAPLFVGGGARATIDVTLQVGQLQQAVVVTAAAAAIPQSQTGAPITVLDSRTLEALNKPDVLESLRLVPGAQVVQVGARGATTSFFIRGGAANFNKVLIDGIVANDIGGGFDFAQLSTAGVEQVEVLRQTNSVVYGTDALAGVISVTTRRGRTRTPEVRLSAEGGNLGSGRTDASVGGMANRFDYFSALSFLTTDNDVPNNDYRNGTYSGRFGVALNHGSDLSVTVRRTAATFGSPSAFGVYRIADDSRQKSRLTYAGVALQSQLADRLQTTVRFGSTDFTSRYRNPSPSGTPYDPFGFGPSYLGLPVRLTGANGYSASGRAILDFDGTYPSEFDTRTVRRALSGQATLDLTPAVSLSAGGRYERESAYSDPDADAAASRDNGGAFVEGRAAAGARLYLTAGLGYEHNAAFGSALVPRLSIASYVRRQPSGAFGDTKLTLNAGSGIKAPSISQEQSSLRALVEGTPAAAGIATIGPERSKSFDVGVEQILAGGAMRARAAYFHNDFDDLIEFLGKTVLPLAGVPAEVANTTAFGAYVNSQSYGAQGLELSGDAAISRLVRVMASYTFLDAEVTEAFSASRSFNPDIPGIAIGAFSPLVGARPFRRPTHSGNVAVIYTPGRLELALSAYFAGKRDDSTFATDESFGNTLLLPNRDLDAAYQKVDLSAAFDFTSRVGVTLGIENLFDQDYEAAFGFPALPLTGRVGVRVSFGGDGGRP